MIQRVNGSLAVSRALGDYEYKVSPLQSVATEKEVIKDLYEIEIYVILIKSSLSCMS